MRLQYEHPEDFYIEDPDTGCWNWQRQIYRGYGHLQDGNGRRVLAHRFVYELHHGRIPDGMDIHHVCENKQCVNPAHLEPKGRGPHIRGHKSTLTTADVVELRERAAAGELVSDLARERGLSAQHIWDVVTGRRWPEVGGPTTRPETRCEHCGGAISRRRQARYCSESCRFAARWLRKKARLAEERQAA